MRNRRVPAIAAVAVCAVLTIAGCSTTGGRQAAQSAGGGGGQAVDTPRMKVAMITHAAPGDTFWDLVQKGAEQAARKDNVELVYSSDPNSANQANLVQNAVDQKVDGIALTLAKPDAVKGALDKAKAANIPVVGFNAGITAWKDAGLTSYFGSDEDIAGQAMGKRLSDQGAKHNVCVIMEQGNVALETRCAGVQKTFSGQTEILNVNGTSMPSVQSAITAKLQQDPNIDYVITLGAPFALTAAQAVKGVNSKAKVATFDTNKQLIGAIKSGDVQFAVDQQPYLQGYLAVDSLWLYKSNGNFSGGSAQPVLTGPAFIDKDNVDRIATFAEKGTR